MEKTTKKLDQAVGLVEAKFGPKTSESKPELVAAVLQSLSVESALPQPTKPLSMRRFFLAAAVFFWWLLLLLAGNQVNSESARRLLGDLGQIRSPTNVVAAANPNAGVDRPADRVLSFKVYLDGKELSAGTNALPAGLAAQVPSPAPEVNFTNVVSAIIVAVLCWTWSNLIFLAAAASAFGALLTRDPDFGTAGIPTELAWSMINGFFVVVFLGCSQIFLGDSVYRSLGLNEALQVQIRQDRYLNLAFFASLLGLFLGLAQQRLSALPAKLPVIGQYFR